MLSLHGRYAVLNPRILVNSYRVQGFGSQFHILESHIYKKWGNDKKIKLYTKQGKNPENLERDNVDALNSCSGSMFWKANLSPITADNVLIVFIIFLLPRLEVRHKRYLRGNAVPRVKFSGVFEKPRYIT